MKAKINTKKSPAHRIVHHTARLIKLAVIPHKHNDYRPHLIRRSGLMALACVVIGMQLGYNAAVTGDVLGLKTLITIPELLQQTNDVRTSYSVGRLKLNEKLNTAAYAKATDMFEDQYWAHVAPDGTEPWKWFGDVDYKYSEAGENLAKNFTTTSATMTAWMNSPGHKTNLLYKNYTEVGFAIKEGTLDGKPTTLVVALYGTPTEAAIASAEAPFHLSGVSADGAAEVLSKITTATQSITSAAALGIAMILIAIVVATLAQIYNKKLPRGLRNSWYRHHGAYKAVGLSVFCVGVLLFYSSGQL